MKKKLSSFITIVLLILFAARLWTMNSQTNSYIGKRLDTAFNVEAPNVIMFWNVDCGPCKVELGRLKDAVNDGEIKETQVTAIHIGQSEIQKYNQYIKNEAFPFQVIIDPDVYETYFQIKGTPTTLFIDKKRFVTDALVGISPTLIWKIKGHYD